MGRESVGGYAVIWGEGVCGWLHSDIIIVIHSSMAGFLKYTMSIYILFVYVHVS